MVVDFDPVLFSLGPLQVRWYGLMYMIGFLVGGQLLAKLAKENIFSPGKKKVDSLVMHLIIGMLLGARLAYVFIYNWDYYQNHLSELLNVWQGGLSFHGAIAGMAVAAVVFARRKGFTIRSYRCLRRRRCSRTFLEEWQLHQWRALRASHSILCGYDF